MVDNIEITRDEMQTIRALDDFDLKMLLSEINDHGWLSARALLVVMTTALLIRGRGNEIAH